MKVYKKFYIAGDNFDKIEGNTRTTYNTTSFDYNQAIQSTDAISKSTADHSVRGGVDQTLIDMRAYSVKTQDPKTGEVMFSIVPGPEIDADGLIMYDEKKNPKMKDPIRLLDEDGVFIQENFPVDVLGPPYQKIEEVLKDVMQQSILLDGGAYVQQEKRKITSSTIPTSSGGGNGDKKLAKWEVVSKTAEALIGNASDELSSLTIEQMKDDPTMVEGVLQNLLGKTRNNSNAVRVSTIKGVPTAVFVHQDSNGADINEFIPLDDMNKFKQRMINISEVYELDSEGIPKLVQGVSVAKPTDPTELRETKVSRGIKSKRFSRREVKTPFLSHLLIIF